MNKIILIFALLAVGTFAYSATEELKPLWSSWKLYHGKSYSAGEEAARFAIFVENFKKVVEFNSLDQGVKLGLNSFSDLTADEFSSLKAGCYVGQTPRPEVEADIDYSVLDLPTSVDWRTKNVVTPVKDQGQCGSCWSFSTTGALEALYAIKTGKLLSFSEQQIVDCDHTDMGCNGGLPAQALAYTAQNGIMQESYYPYTAHDGTCRFNPSTATKVNTGYTAVQTKNSDALKAALVNQPVSIAIEADQAIFQQYKSGVISNKLFKKCGANLDHAVLAVGYGSIDGVDAFYVKNSWGEGWGQSGYVYISTDGKANGGNGVCGILADPVVPK
jgi:hypothetical protein